MASKPNLHSEAMACCMLGLFAIVSQPLAGCLAISQRDSFADARRRVEGAQD